MTGIKRGKFAELDGATVFAIARLRQEVFVVEQECAYPDLDDYDLDAETVHFWVEGESPAEAVATLRVLRDRTSGDAWKIGRVCTALSARGTGLSAKVFGAAMDFLGPEAEVTLGAQTYAAGFYRRFGFTEAGEEYDEDGIMHIEMRRLRT
ncbi:MULTISPECIES: GNAT family N-acetyltransferase [Glycomyces]|uniref:ElaA protein n=2 Tax=Glycomyces TaxID=58113 RepID=A0A9X3PK56_9ACTN|nr:GNAT family N-acetyltransferase [Glycomyces lechevalierae]MDA1385286.1 GNAT family N-acetyltransferase [Glycomyces lechevalierae]MDR7337097.1 ElaA protein [Glycomyces lechevalierae]